MLELPSVTSQIAKSEKTLFSFEILPPLKGQHFEHIQQAVEPLMDFNPAFVNVTYHQEEFEYKQLQNGLLEKKIVRKLPGRKQVVGWVEQAKKLPRVINY